MPYNKLKMVLYPDPRLREEAKEITDINNPKWQNIMDQMSVEMAKQNGIGLAGPQVGIMDRIILIDTVDGPLPLINPEITHFSKQTAIAEEGCLSIPHTFGTVQRPVKITVKALAHDGETLEFTAEDLFARVIQHEIDHLNGILFIDKVIEYSKNPGNLPLPSNQS